MKGTNHRYFAPMKEVVYYTVEVDGKKLPGLMPYSGTYVKTIDSWREHSGIKLKEATIDDYAAVNAKTTLHKRIIKCFEKHFKASKKKHEETTVNRN